MAKKRIMTVTVAVTNEKVVVGTSNSVVLGKIGASARKLGVAKKRVTDTLAWAKDGRNLVPVVRSKDGRLWEVYDNLVLLRVKKAIKSA